jgi:hypothetical protein
MSKNNNIMQQCNLYATNPQLVGVKSDYDLVMNSVYCPMAMSQPYGPNFAPSSRPVNTKVCPFKPLSSAYEFSGSVGPTPVDRKPAYNL